MLNGVMSLTVVVDRKLGAIVSIRLLGIVVAGQSLHRCSVAILVSWLHHLWVRRRRMLQLMRGGADNVSRRVELVVRVHLGRQVWRRCANSNSSGRRRYGSGSRSASARARAYAYVDERTGPRVRLVKAS